MMDRLERAQTAQPNWGIGVDFDNTIVTYDDLMYRLAVERNWVSPDIDKSKKSIRDRMRQLPNGDIEWQKLQALAYGSQMSSAVLIEGVKPFFEHCRQSGIPTYIVSHKTEYANFDPSRTNLRTAALDWMTQHQFFEAAGLGLTPERVYFESTRADKVRRVGSLNCRYFIDDLEETFLEPDFPATVKRLLYDPHRQHSGLSGVTALHSWHDIHAYLFATVN